MFPGLGRLYGRWSRSGVAPRWFYVAFGLGFGALAIVGAVRGDAAVAAAAAIVAVLALAGGLWLNALLARTGRDGGPQA